MTDYQAKQIRALRQHGAGYKAIANATGLSRDIVRNYCKSHGLNGDTETAPVNMSARIQQGLACRNCGAPLVQPPTGRRRRFCSDECRKEWWAAHAADTREGSAANYHLTCIHCGQEFVAYGNRGRKYCSYDCYIQHRFYSADRIERRKVSYDLVCANCSKSFRSLGNPNRKYCSRDCFNQHQASARKEKQAAAAQAGKELYERLMGKA